MRPFLRGDLKVILADEPTQGVDVGARLDIYHALRDKAAEGTTVLVKSSDAIELAGICDRVVVMSRGVIVDEIPREELEERRIIAAIIGRGSAHGGHSWRVTDDVRPKFQLGRWLPIAAMMLLIFAPRRLHEPAGLVVPVDVQPQRCHGRHAAIGAGRDGPDQRADGQGVRRVGRCADHAVCRRGVVRARTRRVVAGADASACCS